MDRDVGEVHKVVVQIYRLFAVPDVAEPGEPVLVVVAVVVMVVLVVVLVEVHGDMTYLVEVHGEGPEGGDEGVESQVVLPPADQVGVFDVP